MKIACVGYREWALNIYDNLASNSKHLFLIFRSREQFSEDVLRSFNPDLVFFYGWSWRISQALLDSYTCLMFHPSPLPKYRGGSPLQNQIIDGVQKTKVSIFKITQELDAGDLVAQEDMCLKGSLKEILNRMEDIGFRLTLDLIENGLHPWPQGETGVSYFKRRLPSESEITIEELKSKSSEYLYNKIRMLASPYPNAFIKTIDGKKLLILDSRIEELD
jgi:methionyl-tRNA formyltransferase